MQHVLDKDKKLMVSKIISFSDIVAIDQGPQFHAPDWNNLLHATELHEKTTVIKNRSVQGVR